MFCFNCRWSWQTATAEPVSLSSDGYAFNPQEFARLHVYRAAFRNGFYTDQLS
jgi:hypothetical protein